MQVFISFASEQVDKIERFLKPALGTQRDRRLERVAERGRRGSTKSRSSKSSGSKSVGRGHSFRFTAAKSQRSEDRSF